MARFDRAESIEFSSLPASADRVNAILRELEVSAVERLALRPRRLPRALGQAIGAWKDRPIRLQARCYGGPRIAMARFVEMVGPGLSIANMLAVPLASLGGPVLGIEIVHLHGREPLVVADSSPVESAATEGLLPLPPWFRAIASADATMQRVAEAELPRLSASLGERLAEFADRVAAARPRPQHADAVMAAVDRYMAIHRTEDRGLGLLAKIFGSSWAELFVRHVLFPSSPAVFRANLPGAATEIGDAWTPPSI